MKRSKVLNDLIVSANSAKAHLEVLWALMEEAKAKPGLVDAMNMHNDFFRASTDAHYTAFFVYLAHLYDKRPDSSSISTYLREVFSTADPKLFQQLENEYSGLAARAASIVTARHKTVAHIDAKLTEKEVFAPLSDTWNQVRGLAYDSATFVAKLAGTTDLGSIGICRDRRFIEATIRLIRALPKQ